MSPRHVNTDSPAYQIGVADANNQLDRGGASAADWLGMAEWVAEYAHQKEDDYLYHMAKGFADTVREFLDGQGQ